MATKSFKKQLLDGDFIKKVQEAVHLEAVSSPQTMHNFLSPVMAQHPFSEKFYVVLFNAKNQILHFEPIFNGTITSCSVHPREVVMLCLDKGAAAISFAHNHPSGDLEISNSDMKITKLLIGACKVHGITVHDHLICSGENYASMAELGIITNMADSIDRFFREI